MRHHTTSCDRERKRVGSGWRKTSFVRRRCGRETRWRERKRKAGGSRKRERKTSGCRKRKGFPLHVLGSLSFLDLHVYAFMAFPIPQNHGYCYVVQSLVDIWLHSKAFRPIDPSRFTASFTFPHHLSDHLAFCEEISMYQCSCKLCCSFPAWGNCSWCSWCSTSEDLLGPSQLSCCCMPFLTLLMIDILREGFSHIFLNGFVPFQISRSLWLLPTWFLYLSLLMTSKAGLLAFSLLAAMQHNCRLCHWYINITYSLPAVQFCILNKCLFILCAGFLKWSPAFTGCKR